jgi:hypothetical protein
MEIDNHIHGVEPIWGKQSLFSSRCKLMLLIYDEDLAHFSHNHDIKVLDYFITCIHESMKAWRLNVTYLYLILGMFNKYVILTNKLNALNANDRCWSNKQSM